MDDRLSDEELADIRKMFPHNTTQHIKRVRRLLRKAQPGNFAWRTLENEYGFSGDYDPKDHGEPPQGAKW